ncbi:hypothetical protein DMENIID0001_001600 [Sergentomyia squamirostris]
MVYVKSSLIFVLVSSVCGIIEYHETIIPSYTPTNTEGMGEALFLTPYIQSSDIETALVLAFVRHPRMEHLISYSGFLTVDERYNSNLFFWFFKAQKNWKEAPVVIWLAGGPGTTTFFPLFYEIGPFYLTLELDYPPREYSWHIDHNIIFIDNPVGTGYSFTDNEDGYATTQADVAEDLYEALQQFFTLFPNLRSNSFFLCGESYGAQYLVTLGLLIHNKNTNALDGQLINLQGISIGNAIINGENQIFSIDMLYQLGFIDAKTADVFDVGIEQIRSLLAKGKNEEAVMLVNDFFWTTSSLMINSTGLDQTYNYLNGLNEVDFQTYVLQFITNDTIRKAMHVGGQRFYGINGNPAAKHLTSVGSVAPELSELLSYYPVMLYTGQTDLELHITTQEDLLYDLDFQDHDLYVTAPRKIWRVDGEVAGYVKEAGFLKDVMVRNAGHVVPLDQPKWCLELTKHMTFQKKLNLN